MLPSHFSSMLLVAITVLFLISMPTYEASRIIPGEEKQNLLSQVPPISMSVPNPLTTTSNIPPSTISQNAFASDDTNYVFPLLRRKLLKGYVPPSTPNPGTYIPSLPWS